jgi:hypothetical protein
MAAPRRKTIDTATLNLSDGTVVKLTVGESDDGRPPLIRIAAAPGHTPRVTGLWIGGGEPHVEVEIVS